VNVSRATDGQNTVSDISGVIPAKAWSPKLLNGSFSQMKNVFSCFSITTLIGGRHGGILAFFGNWCAKVYGFLLALHLEKLQKVSMSPPSLLARHT